jgi:hypothetical protein
MSLLYALLPAALLAPVPKDLEAQIKWRLKKGDVFYVSTDDVSTGTVAVNFAGAPAPMNTSSRTRLACKYEVLAAEPNARAIKVTYLTYLLETGVAGQPLNPSELDVNGATVTLHLNDRYEVVKTDGYKAFADRLGGKALAMFGTAATEKGIAEGLRQVFAVVPPKGVNGGAKWEEKTRLPMGDFGALNRTVKCTAADLKDGTGFVAIDTLAEYAWTADGKGDGKVGDVTVKAADLKAEKCKGTVTFDPKRGRLVSCTEEMPLVGTMSIQTGNTAVDMTLTMTIKRTLTVSDTAPKAK